MDNSATASSEVYEAPAIESVIENSDIEREIYYAGGGSFIFER
jgi:hypothetical protein